jgi:hypothetical protein
MADDGAVLVATLLKASFLQVSSLPMGCSGGNPRSGYQDRTMATHNASLPIGGIVLEQTLDEGGSEVERRVSPRIDDGWSWWRGATKSR